MRCRSLVLAVALPWALTACGATATGTLDAGTASKLDSELAAVRGDASRGARSEALAALSSFSADVDAAGRAGRLTPSERAALDTGIARVRRTLATASAASSPAAASAAAGARTIATSTAATSRAAPTTAAPATTPAAPAPTGRGHGKGEKHGPDGGPGRKGAGDGAGKGGG